MKFKYSTIAIFLVLLACLYIDFNLKNWEKNDRIIEHDVHWYYAYLPAAFIYHDLKLEKSDYQFDDHYYLFWTVKANDSTSIIKTTLGMSILYSPFFFIAHSIANLTDYPENGFSEPYKFLLLMSAIFYLFIGLDFLKKTLKHYQFSDKLIAITILLIGLGTNLLAYSSQSAAMSHVYNFCLFSIFIYYTIKWYQHTSFKNTLILGLLLGLISLIRPSNAVIFIFFVFFNISSWTELKERVIFYKKYFFFLLIIFILSVIVWIPQLMYWKLVTGNYIVYSYTDEGFFFNKPQILSGLFGFRKGWLLYTPMMGFSLIGIFLMKDTLKKMRLTIITFLIINIYIIFSWWCWWYGGSFGQRSLVESYAILALPFASFVKFISEKKWYYNVLFYCVVLFFIWLNIFQTVQYENMVLHWDSMTKELYFKQFGKLNRIENYEKYLDCPNYEDSRKGRVENNQTDSEKKQFYFNSQNEKSKRIINLIAANGKYICADINKNNIVIADRDIAKEWETFTLILFENNECAFLSSDSNFLSAEIKQQNEITATRKKINSWEIFTMYCLNDSFVAFKAVNGKYLSIDEKNLQIFAKADSIGKLEKFEIIYK